MFTDARLRATCAFLFVIAVAAPIGAQSRYVAQSWTTAQGLPQNSVKAIVQTRDGYLWLGTFSGLVRFDGVRFAVFDTANTPALTSNRILTLFEDHNGALWIGTEGGGLVRHRDGIFSSHANAPDAPRQVDAIGEDAAGRLWVSSPTSTVLLDRNSFTADALHETFHASHPRLHTR
jgi:ligand-binding sensor domain-containing protein